MTTPSADAEEPAFVRAYPGAERPDDPAHWLLFSDDELTIVENEGTITLPHGDAPMLAALTTELPVYLGTLDGVPCLAGTRLADTERSGPTRTASLRTLYGQVAEEIYSIAGYAAQILYFLRTSRFCGVCGNPTEAQTGDWGRRCSVCGHTRYPHVSPAVLCLVHDGDRVLLAHKPGWGSRYSILAGFVEPGESLEECARRETREEAGVHIADVTYDGSQPWPYPSQLMVGFTARYVGGELQADQEELDDARWFRFDDLPDLPPPLSLSRQLIDRWVAGRPVT